MKFSYEQILSLLSTEPELKESQQYYTDCISAIKELIDAIDAKLKENCLDDLESNLQKARLKVERNEVLSKKKAYESYLTEKIKAIERNRQLESVIAGERAEFMASLIEEMHKKTNAPSYKQAKELIDHFEFNEANLSLSEKNDIYMKLRIIQTQK